MELPIDARDVEGGPCVGVREHCRLEALPKDGGYDPRWFDCSPDMRVVREEIFGPAVVIQPFDSEDDAVRMANDSPYGLNAMLFMENVRRAHRVAGRPRAGTVWVNCFFVRNLRSPFGGYGDSGIGREGGKFGREFFTEAKAVVLEL